MSNTTLCNNRNLCFNDQARIIKLYRSSLPKYIDLLLFCADYSSLIYKYKQNEPTKHGVLQKQDKGNNKVIECSKLKDCLRTL